VQAVSEKAISDGCAAVVDGALDVTAGNHRDSVLVLGDDGGPTLLQNNESANNVRHYKTMLYRSMLWKKKYECLLAGIETPTVVTIDDSLVPSNPSKRESNTLKRDADKWKKKYNKERLVATSY
jgi:hypothetical protein